MDGNREAAHNLRLSEELQDESGLELRLGLGLSRGDSRLKWKASDGPTPSTPSASLTGEPAAVSGGNGTNPPGKPKPSGKPSSLDAALKKFLEGRLDEQDETGRLLDGSSRFNLQKEKPTAAGSTSMGSHITAAQEKSGHQLDLVSNMDGKGNPFLFKEIQLSSGVSSSRGQSPAHSMPLQFVDAFKIGSFGSASGSPHSAEALGYGDGDEAAAHQQEGSEQHRKFQEARKKRKHWIEEQKHQKKGKKDEDKGGTHGFRRPGSNTWVRGLDASVSVLDVDRALLGLPGSEPGEQLQQEIRQDKQQESVDTGKGYETDGNESTGIDNNESTDVDHNESTGTGNDSKGVEVNFMPQLQAHDAGKKEFNRAQDDAWHFRRAQTHAAKNMQSQGRDNTLKEVSALPNNQQKGQLSALSIGREGEKAGSPLRREREKVPSETSSTGTDCTEKREVKSRGIGEASSAPPEITGSDKSVVTTTAAPFLPPAVTSSAALPYSPSPFSAVPIPYSLPVSVANAPGMPFPLGFSFPYLMQYVPPGSDGQEQNSMQPVVSSMIQPPPWLEYPPPHFTSLEGMSGMQALRPSVVPPFSNANNGAFHSRNSVGMVIDVNSRPQGTKVHENGDGAQNVLLTVDASALGNHPSFRAASHDGTQDRTASISQLHQASDLLLHSSLPVPAVPHFGSQRTLSDPGEACSFKEQGGGINAFPGFAASVQSAQGLLGSLRPPSSGMNVDGGAQEQFGGKVDTAAVHHRNNTELSNLAQEEFRRALGAEFHQGSTDNLSELDGLGEDIHPGIAPGLKFGGTGSPPDLPWVYTSGLNGRTIGGVLYRLSQSQVRIVCACHGKNMSPGEFVQHAGGVDVANPEKNIVV